MSPSKQILETISCNLCGSTRLKVAYRMPDARHHKDEWFSVVECEDCGLGFVNPRPPLNTMDKYYPANFFDYFVDRPQHHQERYRRELAFVDAAKHCTSEPPRLLDIGCANGDFPRYAREHGFVIEGVEIAQNANDIKDFPVYRTPFNLIPVHEPRFDVVTAWAVLEHVHDPMSYFRKASQVLKPGGVFVFLVTNFESLSSRFLFQEDVPRHLFFFSQKTVQRYLQDCGFALEKCVFDDSIYEMLPVHWLRHMLRQALGLPPMTWSDLPETRLDFCKRHNMKAGLYGSLLYALCNPLTVLDHLLMPLYAKYQQMKGSYGIGVFVARKL